MSSKAVPLASGGTNDHPPEADLSSDSITSVPGSPDTSRQHSRTSSSSFSDEWDPFDKLPAFDFLDQFALPQRLDKINKSLQIQSENLKKQRDNIKEHYVKHKQRVLKRTDVEMLKYKQKYSQGLDKLAQKWSDPRAISTREKFAFVIGVSNIFVTGFLVGGYPEWVHIWYSVQLLYFMPLRYYTYHKRGYHYFLADLCYFVNVLLMLCIWVFPNSRRLMISTYCLAFGNNAWAIAMWRNSLVFHSLDKVTSLFIHIMPPVVLHCMVHLLEPSFVDVRFPAISRVKGVEHYGLWEMVIWATVPYAVWQLGYHFLITVRRRDKIAAGRPTSFTWLRRTYSKTWLGKHVLRLPEPMQEAAFMFIQYSYAVVTMLPCTFWFYHRTFSALFITAVGLWSVYNGATYYIDVFGNRFQNELEQLKKEVAKWQNSPLPPSPLQAPSDEQKNNMDGAGEKCNNGSDENIDNLETLNNSSSSLSPSSDLKKTETTTATAREEIKSDGGEVRERNFTTSVTTESS